MTIRPQNTAKVNMGGTGVIQVAKKATPVVDEVRSIALAASGKAVSAISSEGLVGFASRAFFHLSTATNKSSAPIAAET